MLTRTMAKDFSVNVVVSEKVPILDPTQQEKEIPIDTALKTEFSNDFNQDIKTKGGHTV